MHNRHSSGGFRMFKVEKTKLKKRIKNTSATSANAAGVKVCSLDVLVKNRHKPINATMVEEEKSLALIRSIESLDKKEIKDVVFVSPYLPHPCEMEIWNGVAGRLGVKGRVVTAHSERHNFEQFSNYCDITGISLNLVCSSLDTIPENKTFLAGIENEILNADLVIAVGEASLSSYQCLKARRKHQNRLVVWQTAPRPPKGLLNLRGDTTSGETQIARERTVRREVLKNCDAILSFDKDSSTWAYLEDVSAQRIRRVSRGVNVKRFSMETNATQRLAMRASLGLPEADYIFLQAGPLEVEAGALDSVYAFKNLLQSDPSLVGHTKLAFCGTGSAGADVRQAVVDLQLDDHVFFLNPNDSSTLAVLGNQLSNLLSVCDALVHNPLIPVNGAPQKHLDCSYDIICALALGLTVISNSNGWAGEWLSRFYKTFGAGSIHSQAKLMRESIEKQDRLMGIKKAVRTAIENELEISKTESDLVKIFTSLMASESKVEDESISKLFNQIEKAIQARQYLDAIRIIEHTFTRPNLTQSQQSQLFRNIGDCFMKLGDTPNGRANYLRATELDPFCAKTFIGLGTVALQEHNYHIAVPQFQKAVSLAPSDDMASLGLGLAFEGMTEIQESYNWTLRACTLNSENTVAIFNLVKLSYELDAYPDAEKILSKYVSLHPNDVNMAFTLGGIQFKLGKLVEAVKQMEAILVLDPTNERAQGLLTQIQREAALAQKRQA